MTGRRHECIATIGASMLVAVMACGVRTANAQTPSLSQDAGTNPGPAKPQLFPASFGNEPRLTATFLPDDEQDPLQEPEKPTRGFISALGHNLVDDIKHLPRRNSVFWLMGGGAAAIAVHPI